MLVVLIVAVSVGLGSVLFYVGSLLGWFLPSPSNEYEAYHQRVLRKLKWNFYTLFHCNKYKHEGVAKFAWAIPNKAAIDAIIATVPIKRSQAGLIVDFGAGSGYWPFVIARYVKQRHLDIDIVAIEKSLNLYAKREDGSIGIRGQATVKRSDLWFDVQAGGIEDLLKLQSMRPIDTLLLVWPPCWEDMAFNAVRAFRGRHVIYVGETKGGCTVSCSCTCSHKRPDNCDAFFSGRLMLDSLR